MTERQRQADKRQRPAKFFVSPEMKTAGAYVLDWPFEDSGSPRSSGFLEELAAEVYEAMDRHRRAGKCRRPTAPRTSTRRPNRLSAIAKTGDGQFPETSEA